MISWLLVFDVLISAYLISGPILVTVVYTVNQWKMRSGIKWIAYAWAGQCCIILLPIVYVLFRLWTSR